MVDIAKPILLQALQCPSCHDCVKSTFLCPKCGHHFCRNCICATGLDSSCKTCPQCRAGLSADQSAASFCKQHSQQQVSLFCNHCEVCICVTCYLSESEHTKHKERVVSLETAIEHHRRKLSGSLDWIENRNKEVSIALDEAQEDEKFLQELKDNTLKLCNMSRKLISGGTDGKTLYEIMAAEKSLNETRLVLEATGLQNLNDPDDIFMPYLTTLTFHFSKSESNDVQEAIENSSDFKWICEVDKSKSEPKYFLTLVHGKASKFAVAIENQPEKFVFFKPVEPVELEAYDLLAQTENECYKLRVNLRKTYKDRCQQFQVQNKQLKKQKADNERILKNLKNKQDRLKKGKIQVEASKLKLPRSLLYAILPLSLCLILHWFWIVVPNF